MSALLFITTTCIQCTYVANYSRDVRQGNKQIEIKIQIFLILQLRTRAVYEVFERMAYYGISSNLVLYLTTKLHQGVVPSANNVTNWVGTIWMTPIIGAYVADAHLGRYRTFMVASVIYLSVSPPPFASVSIRSVRLSSS